ncbi:PKD domain-containing protein [Flagellimonas iocasae]|uniref:PKD domain-containing protein n=1 Tax=Flagellimonas iocasae TaxID=2055905 RepID=A0ABW4Y2C3_9FLAO
MNNVIRIPVLVCLVGMLLSCGDEDFAVPPASTVPKFTYTVDNDELAPSMATFTNTSIVPSSVGEATFYWNFGDGESSRDANPQHLYTKAGAYTVNLVVTTSISLEVRKVSETIVIKDPNATGVPIYYTDGSTVFQALINTQAPIFTALEGPSLQSSYGMVMDTVAQKIYMSDYGADKIYRANLDGSGFEEFRTGIDSPNGLAIDYGENQIYWDNSSGIQRADLNSSDLNQKEDFVTGQTNDPDGLSIDPVNRKLYWINYNGGIGSKNLDGTGETMLFPDIEGGTIMVINDRIYFDEYVDSGDIRIKSADLDGNNINTLAVGIGRVVYGIGYDPNDQKIYWGDRGTDIMWRADLDGGNPESWFTAPGDTRGIIIGKKQ